MITLVLMLFSLITFTQGASAAQLTWNGNGPDATWSASSSGGTKNNWTTKGSIPAPNSTNDFIFAGTTRLNNINDIDGLTATSITFTNAAGGFILNGNSITLAGGITNLSTNLQTINLGLILSGNDIVNASSANILISSNVSGTGTLTAAGASTLTLSTSNSYSGGTILNAGTIAISNNYALGTGRVTFASNSTTLQALANLTLSNNITLTANGIFDSGAFALTNSGIISGAGSLQKAGAGTLVLANENTYTGTTLISAGALQIGNGGAPGSLGTNNITNNSSLIFNRTGAFGVANLISGSGSLTQSGTGTLTLSGSNSYAGTTTISRGALALNGTNSGAGLITVATNATLFGTGKAVGNVTLDSGGSLTPGSSSSTGTLTVAGVTFNSGANLNILLSGSSTSLLTISGADTTSLGGNLNFSTNGIALTSGYYTFLTSSSTGAFSGSFGSTNSVPTGYAFVYGVSGGKTNSLALQQLAVLSSITGNVTGTNAIITGGSAAFTVGVSNSAFAGGENLVFAGTASANTTGSIGSTTVTAQGSTNGLTGLTFTGTTTGAGQKGVFTINAPTAIPTSGTGTVTVDVYGHALGSVNTNTVNLGNFHTEYAAVTNTSLLNASNTGAFVVNLKGNSVTSNGVTLGAISGVAQSNTGNISVALAAGLSAGAINQSLSYTFADSSTLSGASSSNSSASITVTGGVYNYAAGTLASTNINLGNVHVGGTFSSSALSLNNSATGPANYVENLGASFGSGSGATGTGSFTGLASGATNNGLRVSLSGTATAGTNNGSIALNLNSEAVNGSGLGTTALTGKTVVVTGFGYTGQSYWTTTGSGNWTNFGNWNLAGGTPGLDGALSLNDTATFGSGGSGGVTLDGAAPSIQTLTFSNASSGYTLAQGTGGSLTLKTGNTAASIKNNAGSHTISANVILADDTTLNAATGTELNISGGVSGSGKGLTKAGVGAATLSGNNSYSGTTTVNGGTLVAGSSTALGSGAGALTVNNDSTLALGSYNATVGEVTLNSGSITGSATLTGSSYTVSSGTIAPTLAGSGVTLTKTGLGSVTLNAAETFTGKTTVSAGTLILAHGASLASTEINLGTSGSKGTLDASALSGGGITIGNGQTLAGYGTVVGNTIIDGTLAPGNSPGVIGITGDLTINSGSTSIFEVKGLGGAGAVDGFDQVNVSGALTYGGVLKLDVTGSYNMGTAFQDYLFNFGSETGGFSSVKYRLNGSGWSDLNYYAANNTWQMWDNNALTVGADNGYIGINLNTGMLTVVPEPSTWALLVGGVSTLMILRRRRG